MKGFFSVCFIFLQLNTYAGNGYMAASGQLAMNMSEVLTQRKFNISYDYFIKRDYSLGFYASYLNNEFALSDKSSFSYFGVKPSTYEKVSVQGCDFIFRGWYSSPFQNKVLPLGITYGVSLGIGRYKIHEVYGNMDRSSSRTTIIWDLSVKNTFNIYKELNGFYGINAGWVADFTGHIDDPDDVNDLFHLYPRRGLNAAVAQGNFIFTELLHFNIDYGLTYTL